MRKRNDRLRRRLLPSWKSVRGQLRKQRKLGSKHSSGLHMCSRHKHRRKPKPRHGA